MKENNVTPWIHPKVVTILEKIIGVNTKILEFGSGNSTVFFSKLTDNVYSVEHDDKWYNKIKPQLNNNVKYILSKVDYISKPRKDKTFYNCNTIEELFNTNIPDDYFDIIIVDGIHRVNCAYASLHKLKKGGILILDDSNRIKNPASDGSYMPIKILMNGCKEYKFRSSKRNTDFWIKSF